MKKILISIFTIFILAFCFASQINADTATPRIYASNLNYSTPLNNQIKGQFTVWNAENFYATDLNYSIRLFKGTDFDTLQLIDTDIPQEKISISPNQTITQSFTYQYPKNITSGSYTLRAQIITAKGIELGWNDQVISLTGTNNFLDIKNNYSRVLVGKKTALPQDGIGVSSKDRAIAFLKVKNYGGAITVVPEIRIFKRQYNMDLVKQYQDSSITFTKNEEKDISLSLPNFDTPESYLAEVKFYKDNQQISGIQYFRWVVEGSSGKILNITTDKDSYAAGENMKINIDYVGPADLTTINGTNLQITVYDQDKKVIAVKTETITLGHDLSTFVMTIPIGKDLLSPMIDSKLINSNQILDEYEITLPIFSKQAKQLQQKSKKENISFYPLFIIVLIVLMILLFKSQIASCFLSIKNKISKK